MQPVLKYTKCIGYIVITILIITEFCVINMLFHAAKISEGIYGI